ncbi:fused MFS/spermidine synthase [Actinosynnema sp. NPDC020468]|uniref:spermidine synthase n=1 Tax=Actinosynnema sp. NPDC020468 TaxID=3154488 RepID=UPI0033F32D45
MGRTRRTDETITREVDSGVAELVPDPDVPRSWLLRLNGTPQSHVDLDDATHLEFEYVRRLGHVVDLLTTPGDPIRALHLGGGGLSLPRYIATTRPRSAQQVVEIDSALVELVRAHLPWDRTWRIKVRTGDARAVLANAPPATFDLVVTDVFAGARTPAHLTSVEFVRQASEVLAPGGVYTANIGDGGGLGFAKAQAATVRAVFPHVAVLAEPTVFRGRRFGNFVLVASHKDLPIPALTRRTAGDPFPGRVEHDTSLTRFIGGLPPTTDATATKSPPPPTGTWGQS